MSEPAPPWAFLLLALAITALALPVVYTVRRFDEFHGPGQGLAVGTVIVAVFAILTVLVSVLRFFQQNLSRRNL